MYIKSEDIYHFREYLIREEKAEETIEKYIREIKNFYKDFKNSDIGKEDIVKYKNKLLKSELNPNTINSKLSALNGLFKFLNHPEYCIKFLKIQRKVFQSEKKELTKKNYEKLVQTAYYQNKEQLALILQTIGSAGIRISELKYITKEAVEERLYYNDTITINPESSLTLTDKNSIDLVWFASYTPLACYEVVDSMDASIIQEKTSFKEDSLGYDLTIRAIRSPFTVITGKIQTEKDIFLVNGEANLTLTLN